MLRNPKWRFPRKMRLSERTAFERLFKTGRKSVDAPFVVLARENGSSYPRLGLAIGRKHFPSSVIRSRLKRIVRESFRLHQHELGGLDILVIARRELGALPVPTLSRSLSRHWRNLSTRRS